MRIAVIIIAAVGLAFAASHALSFLGVDEDTSSSTVASTPQRPTPTPPPPTPITTPITIPTPHIFSENGLWVVVNDWQEKQGHDPYIEDRRLCAFASERLTDVKVLWSHKGFYEKESVLLSDWSNVGENLAKDFSTAEETLSAWLASPSHRENLLDVYYAYSCIRCDTTDSRNMCV